MDEGEAINGSFFWTRSPDGLDSRVSDFGWGLTWTGAGAVTVGRENGSGRRSHFCSLRGVLGPEALLGASLRAGSWSVPDRFSVLPRRERDALVLSRDGRSSIMKRQAA